jgi:hypothetical protein
MSSSIQNLSIFDFSDSSSLEDLKEAQRWLNDDPQWKEITPILPLNDEGDLSNPR